MDTIFTGRIGGNAPLERLALALTSLVQQNGFSFVLGTRKDTGDQRSLFAGHFVSQWSEERRRETVHLGKPGLRIFVSFFKFGEENTSKILGGFLVGARREIEAVQELEDSAQFCNVPITLDGRRLDGLLRHKRWGFGTTKRPLFLRGLRLSGVPNLKVSEEMEERNISLRTHPQRAERGYGGARSFAGWCGATTKGRVNFFRDHIPLYFIQDGVVVDTEVFKVQPYSLDFFIAVNAKDLNCDLTGLSLLQNKEREHRIGQALKLTHQTFLELSRNTDQFVREDRDDSSHLDDKLVKVKRSRKRAAILPALTTPTLGLSVFNPVFGASSALITVSLFYLGQLYPEESETKGGQAEFRNKIELGILRRVSELQTLMEKYPQSRGYRL